MTLVNPASFQFLLLLLFFLIIIVIATMLKSKRFRSHRPSPSRETPAHREKPADRPRGGIKRLSGIIGTVVAVMLLIGICAAVAAPLLNRSQPQDSSPWEPELPAPIKDPEDGLPKGPGSLLRSFAFTHYNLKKTTAENKSDLRKTLIDDLDQHKQDRELYSLPEDFTVRGYDPNAASETAAALSEGAGQIPPEDSAAPEDGSSGAFKTAGTLQEYDQQILDAYNKISLNEKKYSPFQYRRIAVTALNCLDLLSRECENGTSTYDSVWENYLYYGELAVWALANEYVCTKLLQGGERVDLFYRFAQAYDHVGTATTDEDPPFKHELYFIASASLNLSFLSLEVIDFTAEGHQYRGSVWKLYMTMDFRMGKYVERSEDFFESMEASRNLLEEKQVSMTEAEKDDIQQLMDDLLEWRRLHK